MKKNYGLEIYQKKMQIIDDKLHCLKIIGSFGKKEMTKKGYLRLADRPLFKLFSTLTLI